ncbi:MAG: hypothetical protein AABY27_02300 [Pseudomonadota bacterium]
MDYKIEPLETDFGKGIKIKKGIRSYEQFSCRDGLFARVFKLEDQPNPDYRGVIFRAPFKDTNQDYEQFKVLAERLQQISGEEIPNSKAQFMNYISHAGLEQKLSRIGVDVRINLKDKKKLSDNINSWLNKGYFGGVVTGLAGYAGGFAIIANISQDADLIAYGIIAPLLEGFFGKIVNVLSMGKFWCGPMSAPGFIASRIIHKGKLRNPDYMLGKFMQNYQKLDVIEQLHLQSPSVNSSKKLLAQSKKTDRHFGVLEDIFLFTKHQRGFSINYDSPNRNNIISFFNYILEGGNIPKLPNFQAVANNKTKVQEKPAEIKPVETSFINPWEVQIPKLGEKGNE